MKNQEENIRDIKYYAWTISFIEVPDETSLVFSITGCPGKCEGCHSPFLRNYENGYILDSTTLDNIIKSKEKYITTICFLGGDWEEGFIDTLKYCKLNFPKLKTCLYSGQDVIDISYLEYLDYYKIGGYNQDLGPLYEKTTNQRFYTIENNAIKDDITFKFYNN
jgi:anaerobic ribonucleoside-triphosphate reductase activating protein